MSRNDVNESLRNLSIANRLTLSISKFKYLIVNRRCLSRVNAIDEKIFSEIIAKISNEINEKELRRVKM